MFPANAAEAGICFGRANRWKLIASPAGEKISETTIPQEIAWRIFTKGIAQDEARAQIQVAGDETAGLHILKMAVDRGLSRLC